MNENLRTIDPSKIQLHPEDEETIDNLVACSQEFLLKPLDDLIKWEDKINRTPNCLPNLSTPWSWIPLPPYFGSKTPWKLGQ